jgi:hypothetical protein
MTPLPSALSVSVVEDWKQALHAAAQTTTRAA